VYATSAERGGIQHSKYCTTVYQDIAELAQISRCRRTSASRCYNFVAVFAAAIKEFLCFFIIFLHHLFMISDQVVAHFGVISSQSIALVLTNGKLTESKSKRDKLVSTY